MVSKKNVKKISAREELMSYPGRVMLGQEELNESTATETIAVIDEINRGGFTGSTLPDEWLKIDRRISAAWRKVNK